MIFASILLIVGVLIFSMSSWLMPLVAWCIYSLQRHRKSDIITKSNKLLSLDILIPAHNESESLPVTLASMKKLQYAGFSTPQLVVGLSNWSTDEAQIASQLADRRLEINEVGKWRAIVKLIEHSEADWVALVDSGTVWPEDILIQFNDFFSDEQIVAINPKYSEADSGYLQKIVWGLESTLKTLENLSGGPISLHGSTIFYRRKELQYVIQHLKGSDWWNDDVIVPLMLRKFNPSKKIIYAVKTLVVDMFPASNINEMKRRKRLLYGNLQWVQTFFPALLKSSAILSTLALRRITRMLWAWGISFIALGLGLMNTKLFLIYAAVGVAFILMPKGRRFYEAFWVSMMMPIYFIKHKSNLDRVTWK